MDERIEAVVPGPVLPDVITARALAPLDKLLHWAKPWIAANPALTMLLLKGENADAEILAARENYTFTLEQFPSVTSDSGIILRLSKLCPV